MLLRIIAPCGDVDIAGYGSFKAGETFVPRAADVPGLIGQFENFEPADAGARKARAKYEAAYGGPAPAEPADAPADDAPPNENEAQ